MNSVRHGTTPAVKGPSGPPVVSPGNSPMFRLRIRRMQAVYGVSTMIKQPLALAIFATVMSSATFGGSALAADLTSYEPAPSYNEPVSSGSNWTGAYVGAHGGVASRKFNLFSGGNGGVVGVHGGYNADIGGMVIGGEGEVSYLGDTKVKVDGGSLKERHRLAVKGKAGVPLDQTLVYGTGGFAMTNMRDNGRVTGPDGWKAGYIVGAGMEQKLNDKISASVEYNYTSTPNVRSSVAGVTSEKDVHDHSVRLGLNYKF